MHGVLISIHSAAELVGRFGNFAVSGNVMTAMSIKSDSASGYARYLESKTVAPERGDYYLGPTSEAVQAPGRWHMSQATLERLGIPSDGSVEGKDFIALMEGRHPRTGDWLRPEGAGGGRGGGIDMSFSAPKSVSVVWAIGDPWQREQIEQAHGLAVARTLAYMRESTPVVRRRYSGDVLEERAKDVLAAEYRHTTARGVGGAETPDPQLHSHVVVTGAVRQDDRFVAVASRPLFRSARELGAYYRLALAKELARQGYTIEGGTGKEGRYFEIAGVPKGLSDAFSGRTREVVEAAERFRAKYGRAPEREELRNVKLENRRAKELTTRDDLDQSWRETAERYSFGPGEAARLLTGEHEPPPRVLPLADRVERSLTTRRAVFEPRELRATMLEQAVGELAPEQALEATREMIVERRVLPLEHGKMTTLKVRAQEQAIERHASNLAKPANRDVGETARANAAREISDRIGSQLSEEQELALLVLTGPERGAALVGPAGTGKGVVIDAAARAEQLAGCTTLGVAIAGATRERLERDSPALEGQTLTVDSLLARAKSGSVVLDERTTVFFDEAGMADTHRLELVAVIDRAGAKLVPVGDGKQLPSIGPGGMFDRLTALMPVVEIESVRRTRDPDEQRAWAALREGQPERAMAYYRERGKLHLADTRDEAAEAAVQKWAELTEMLDSAQVALIADGSNREIDRLNARAQYLRSERGELGEREVWLGSVHYGLYERDRVAFIRQYHADRQPRVENGSRGEVICVDESGAVTIKLDGSGREVTLGGEDIDALRLGYAQHIYRQQGATVERSVVLTGGWQTSKESAYVQASRARQGTDWHLAREELGTEGTDIERIERLAQKMRTSSSQTPSVEYQQLHEPGEHLDPALHLREVGLPTAQVEIETGQDIGQEQELGLTR
jgi:conjugative relaxase-like TrwC/TraI family protein